MKIAVVGAGGVGGFFAAAMSRGGLDVTLVARGEHGEVISKNGLLVKDCDGDFVARPRVVASCTDLEAMDVIFLTVKSYDLVAVADSLRRAVNAKTIIVTLQNGIDNADIVHKALPQAQVCPGVAYIIGEKLAAGIVGSSGQRRMIFGDAHKQNNAKLRALADRLQQAGVNAVYASEIMAEIWSKFILIVARAGMTSVCRSSIGRIVDDPLAHDLYLRTAREALLVAQAMGVALDDSVLDLVLNIGVRSDPHSKSSMLVDIEHGRPTEVEGIHGTLVRLAKEQGIAVPLNEMICAAIRLGTK